MSANTSEGSSARVEIDQGHSQSVPNRIRSIKPEGSIEDMLCRNIDDVDSSSRFVLHNYAPYEPSMAIIVKDVGPFKFVSTAEEITEFIKSANTAKVGKAKRDPSNTEISSIEFKARDLSFDDQPWERLLRGLCKGIRGELGVDYRVKRVYAKLSGFSIFGKQETTSEIVKETSDPETFGTLVIHLPTAHVAEASWLECGDGTEIVPTVKKLPELKTTYLAYYADAIYRTSPIKEGYKCIMTYDLIKSSDTPTRSLSDFCQRIRTTNELLRSWSESTRTMFLTYPLVPGGAQRNRNQHKIKYLRQCCMMNEAFCLVTASMSRPRKKSKNKFTNFFDFWTAASCRFLPPGAKYIDIPHETIIADYDFGVDKVVSKVILLIPRTNLAKFMVKVNLQYESFSSMHGLGRMLRVWRDSSDDYDFGCVVPCHQLVLEICQVVLYEHKGDKSVGTVATTAAYLHNNALFSRAIDLVEDRLPDVDWESIGSFTNLKSPPVNENLIIKALTKSDDIDKMYRSCKAFNRGLRTLETGRHESAFRRGWLDTVMLSAMKSVPLLSMADIRVLGQMLLDQKQDHPLRVCIWYQNIRKLVTDFGLGICAPLVALEISSSLVRYQGFRGEDDPQSHRELKAILRLVTAPALANFDLELLFKLIGSADRWNGEHAVQDTGALTAQFFSVLDDPQNRRELLLHIRRAAFEHRRIAFVLEFITTAFYRYGPLPPSDTFLLRDILAFVYRAELSPNKSFAEIELDASRPSFTHEGHQSCDCIRRLNAFLLNDAMPQDHEIRCTNPTQRAWHDRSWTSFSAKVKNNDHGEAVLMVHKTFVKLPEKHKRAHKKMHRLLNALGDITKVRDALGDRYNDVCALWLPHNGGSRKNMTK